MSLFENEEVPPSIDVTELQDFYKKLAVNSNAHLIIVWNNDGQKALSILNRDSVHNPKEVNLLLNLASILMQNPNETNQLLSDIYSLMNNFIDMGVTDNQVH